VMNVMNVNILKRRTPIKYISEKDWKDYKIYYIAKLKEEEFSRFKNY